MKSDVSSARRIPGTQARWIFVSDKRYPESLDKAAESEQVLFQGFSNVPKAGALS
jgi:hypothetical protein